MKKRLIVGSIAIFLTATTLVGCTNTSEQAAVNNLSNELDKTNNSISNVKSMTETDLDVTKEVLDKLASQNQSENIQRNIYIAQNAIQNEQNCKDEVMAKTANIKKYLSKNDIKLAKNQVSALKDLSKSLSLYNNSISYSEKEFNTAVNNYNNLKRFANKNPERVNAKLNRIACNSNARSAYYENILNTLDQVENVLGIENSNPYSNEQTYEYLNQYDETTLENELDEIEENLNENNDSEITEPAESEKPKKRRFKKNIDTYLNKEEQEQKESETENNYNLNNSLGRRNLAKYNADTYGPTKRNIDTYRPYGMPYNNGIPFNNPYNYGYGYGYNMPQMPYGNGAYGMQNSPYGYNANNFNRIATPYASTDEVANENREKEEKLNENQNINNESEQENKINKKIKENKTLKPQTRHIKDKKFRTMPKEIKKEVVENKDKSINNSQNTNCPECNNDNLPIEENEQQNEINENKQDCENCINDDENAKKEIGKPRLEEFENEEMKIKEINTSALDVKIIGDDEEKVVGF